MFVDVPSNECFRRISNRKIDPTTGIVYHMEDSPPPEGDNKLKDRLQEYTDPEADSSKINHNHMIYEENASQLKKWTSGFGLADSNLSGYPVVNSKMEVNINEKTKKDEVFEKVNKQLQQVIQFKQALFDIKRDQIRE